MKNNLPITEELDFHYLLSLLPPLQGEPEFAMLPELFSILSSEKEGYENTPSNSKYGLYQVGLYHKFLDKEFIAI